MLYADAKDVNHVSGSAFSAGGKCEEEAARAAPLPATSLAARSVLVKPFNVEQPPHVAVNVGLRCIGVRPDSTDIAVGDRRGTLRYACSQSHHVHLHQRCLRV